LLLGREHVSDRMESTMLVLPFDIDLQRLAEYCHCSRIRRLAVFGSALRSDFGPHSDLDVLVEFEPGHVPGFGFFRIQDELSELLGRQVDLETAGFFGATGPTGMCSAMRRPPCRDLVARDCRAPWTD
jgi:predicted nucleotidyltransferase